MFGHRANHTMSNYICSSSHVITWICKVGAVLVNVVYGDVLIYKKVPPKNGIPQLEDFSMFLLVEGYFTVSHVDQCVCAHNQNRSKRRLREIHVYYWPN